MPRPHRSTVRRSLPLLLALLALALRTRGGEPATRPVKVTVTFDRALGPLEIDRVASLGQGGLSEEPMWDGRAAEVRALRPRVIRVFLQEYFDVMPEKGRYDFSKLEKVVDLVHRCGAEPLMCIAFKPKALFPRIDPAVIEPDDWEEWGRLIEAMVRHYKDRGKDREGAGPGVRYWEVMNEPDIGETGGCPYLFTAANYPPFYERTAAAIRRADPKAKVGGPALASANSPLLDALLSHCAERDVPLDFISWHIYSSDPSAVRGTVERNKAKLAKFPALAGVETFLDEWNVDLLQPMRDPRFQPCYVAETVFQMREAGLDVGCYYHLRDYHVDERTFARFFTPKGVAFMAKWWNRSHQNSGLFDFQNNVRPAYFAFELMSRLTGDRLPLTSDDEHVHGFAARDERAGLYNVMLWNFSSEPARVELKLEGLPAGLGAHPIVLDSRTPSPDANSRLRTLDALALPPPDGKAVTIDLEAYGVTFWMIDR